MTEVLSISYIAYTFAAILISVSFNIIFSRNILSIILLSYFSINAISSVFYNGLIIPETQFLTITDFLIIITFIAQNRFIYKKFNWILFFIVVYLLLNIYKTENMYMYLMGILRGIIVSFFLFKLLQKSKISINEILDLLFTSISFGYVFSLIIVVFRGYSLYEALTSNWIRTVGYAFYALGGNNPFGAIALFLIPLFMWKKKIIQSSLLFLMLLSTMTRGAIILGIAEVSFLMFIMRYSYTKRILMAFTFIFMFYFLGDVFFFSRWEASRSNLVTSLQSQDSAVARFYIWDVTINYISESSLLEKVFGVGYCTYKNNVFVKGIYDGAVSSPHSLGLSILYNYGFFGFITSIMFFTSIVKRLISKKLIYVLTGFVLFVVYGFLVGTILLPEYRQSANFYSFVFVLLFFIIDREKSNISDEN